jgi:hypothetical protein
MNKNPYKIPSYDAPQLSIEQRIIFHLAYKNMGFKELTDKIKILQHQKISTAIYYLINLQIVTKIKQTSKTHPIYSLNLKAFD